MFDDYCVCDDCGIILYEGDSWEDAHDWMIDNCDEDCQVVKG